MSIDGLLSHASIEAADIDVLSIDAEAVSVQLAEAFMLKKGFAPAFFSWEDVWDGKSIRTTDSASAFPSWKNVLDRKSIEHGWTEGYDYVRWSPNDVALILKP